MKLLVITDSYPPHHSGGYEIRCKDVLDHLMLRSHDVEIITTMIVGGPKNESKEIFRQFHTVDVSTPLLQRVYYDYKDIKFLRQRINSFQPDIIYLWHVVNFTRAIFPYLSDTNIPIVYDEGGNGLILAFKNHGFWYSMIERKSNFPIRNKIKKILAIVVSRLSGNLIKMNWVWPVINAYFNSNSVLEDAKKSGVPLNLMKTIHSGIDISRFPFQSRDACQTPVRIIVPGRIERSKGMRDAILLVQSLIRNNIPTKCTIVGKIGSKIYYDELCRLVSDFGLNHSIEFLPMLDQTALAKLYQKSDICFFPSYRKYGLSRIPLEAMSSGCLVLSYGNEGSNEIILSNETGFIIPDENIDSVLSIIDNLIREPDQFKRIIESARLTIEKTYSMERYIDSVEDFLFESANWRKS